MLRYPGRKVVVKRTKKIAPVILKDFVWRLALAALVTIMMMEL